MKERVSEGSDAVLMSMRKRSGGWCEPLRCLAEHGSGATEVEQGTAF